MSEVKRTKIGVSSNIGFNNASTSLVGAIGMVCFLVVFLIQNLIRSLYDPYYGYIPGFIVAMLWLAILSGYLGAKFSERSNRGNIILDCGPTHQKLYYIFCAVFFAVFSFAGGFLGPVEAYWKTAGVVRLQESSGWSFGYAEIWKVAAIFIVCATLSLYFAFLASGRVLVTQHGIWHHWGFLKWETCDAWEFLEDDPSWLVVSSKSGLPFLRTGFLKISDNCRKRLEGLLREHVREHSANRAGEGHPSLP